MSNYGWERGEFVLPSAEVARFKKRMRDAHNDVADEAYAKAKEFWANNRTQSAEKYQQAAERFVESIGPRTSYGSRFQYGGASARQAEVADVVRDVLDRVAWHARGGQHGLRGVTWDDMDGVGWGRRTNRDTTFVIDGEGEVSFNDTDRTVHYFSGDNNHSVDRARGSYMGQAFFGHLERVDWTRGTGGVTWSWSEYDEDALRYSDGYQPSTVGSWYGPRGAERFHQQCGYWPPDSPQAKAERDKKANAERRKAQRKAQCEREQREQRAAAERALAGGGGFCGALKKDGSGLCGRVLAGGRCPDHGTVGGAQRVVLPSGASSVTGSAAASTDPFA